jgi:type IV pilus assembly protein PilF
VHYSYAYYLERVGETKEAEKSYQKAVSLNPKGGNEHNNYGAFLCRQRLYKQAEKEFLKAIEDPNYNNTAEALENAGLCIQQVPDVAKATEYYEKALRYDPNRANALLELSVMKMRERRWLEANDYYNRYSQIAKPNARSVLLGIELAKNNGDKDKEASLKMLLNAEFPQTKQEDFSVSKL